MRKITVKLTDGKIITRQLPRGVYIDGEYVLIRKFPNGVKFEQHVGRLDKPGVLDDAIVKVHEYDSQIRAGRFEIETKAKRMTVNVAAELYWTEEGSKKPSGQAIRIYLNGIKRKWGQEFLDACNHTHTIALRKWLLAGETAPKQSTVNRYHTTWTRLFNFCNDMKRIKDKSFVDVKLPEFNPGKPIKSLPETHKVSEKPFRRRRVVTPDEFFHFCKFATMRVRKVCFAAITTTLRRKDLKALSKVKNIDHEGVARGIQSKTNGEYEVPVAEDTKALIAEGLDFSNFRKEFEQARKDSGLPHFLYKDLRKSAPAIMRKLKTDLRTVQDLLGHATMAMTEVYTPVMDEEKKEALEAVAKLFKQGVDFTDGITDPSTSKDGGQNIIQTAVNQ